MPRSSRNGLPRYVQRVRQWLYFRWADGTRSALPSDAGSPEFHARYAELLAQRLTGERARPEAGTVAALVTDYLSSSEYKLLSDHTRWHYRRLLDHLQPISGFQVTDIRRKHVRELRDLLADRPRTADMFVQAARRVFDRAVGDEVIDVNPAGGIKTIAKESDRRAWTEAECAVLEMACHQDRVPAWVLTAYLLGRYTGQRRGDVLRLTWAAYDGTFFRVRQGKTGTRIEIPVHPRLKAHIDGLPRTSLYILTSPTGRPWDLRNFTRELREVLDKLGLDELSFHGLRHTTATELANAGASEREIMAVTGHRSTESVATYVRSARQRHMATNAIARLGKGGGGNGNGT